MKEALMWKPLGEKKVECRLCSHLCKIPEDSTGICKVRKNEKGILYANTYGKVSSIGSDPIEKKPLYHFLPGTRALSLGGIGCNFRCDFCQNWSISQEYSLRGLRTIEPEELPGMAESQNCQNVSWTYNEPTIWFEYTLDGAKISKGDGLTTSYVTNGYITEEALREISPYLDAMNIDVKAFSDEFYKRRCKTRLQPVLDTCALALELDIFIEITYLLVPTQNDDPKEIKKFCSWVCESLGPGVPVHFSRFHPDFNYREVSGTPMETLRMAYDTAKEEGLEFVYLGNIPHCDEENTYCPKCGTLAIERLGFNVSKNLTEEGKCSQCGGDLNIIMHVD
jgi:pyruvate formate lyase activating enzyme